MSFTGVAKLPFFEILEVEKTVKKVTQIFGFRYLVPRRAKLALSASARVLY